jgi:hypothetical protein
MAVRFSALRTGRCFTPQKHYFYASGTHFCYRLSKSQGLVRQEGLRNLIKIIHSLNTHSLYSVDEFLLPITESAS